METLIFAQASGSKSKTQSERNKTGQKTSNITMTVKKVGMSNPITKQYVKNDTAKNYGKTVSHITLLDKHKINSSLSGGKNGSP